MNAFTLKDWADHPGEHYDLRKEYEERVKPLSDKFIEECKAHEIPCRLHFVVMQNEEGGENVVELLSIRAGRASPELLALSIMGPLDWNTYDEMKDFYEVCGQKFGPNKITPDPILAAYEGDGFTVENWLHTPQEEFDEIEFYKANLEGLIKEIKDVCAALRLPMHGMAVAKYGDGIAHTHSCGFVGGVERGTAEIIAATELNMLNWDNLQKVEWTLEAADQKYGRPPRERGMTLEQLFKQLLGGN